MKKLTLKQEIFVAEYLKDFNATRAAIDAGYSKKTAGQIGEQNLKKLEIQEAIKEATEKRLDKLEITADRVLQELARLAFSDIRQVFDEDGRLKPVHQLSDTAAASISSVKVVTSRIPGTDPVEVEHTSEIKFWDKKGSLELLGKHLKMFIDKIEHTGPNGGPLCLTPTVIELVAPSVKGSD